MRGGKKVVPGVKMCIIVKQESGAEGTLVQRSVIVYQKVSLRYTSTMWTEGFEDTYSMWTEGLKYP